MNEEVYAIAVESALAEIQNTCKGIDWSFIFTKDATIISGNKDRAVGPEIAKSVTSFQNLTEKSAAIGGLDQLWIDGDKGDVYISSIDDTYFISGTSKKADTDSIRSITSVVFPTITRVVENISDSIGEVSPTPSKPLPSKTIEEKTMEVEDKEEEALTEREKEVKKPEETKEPEDSPSQQLIVDELGGLFVRADTVQVDSEVLKQWSTLLNVKEVNEVDIETFSGKKAECKVKTISDSKAEGKGLIRIPDKTCKLLGLQKGELVRVKPIAKEK